MITKPNFEYLSVLDELEYIAIASRSDQIVSDMIKKCLKRIGKSYSKAILYNMCSLYNLSEHELLTNYNLFEASLNRILGNAGNGIINSIKKEILAYAVMARSGITVNDILNPSLKISDIVKYIHEVEMFAFASDMESHHHTILLYSEENKRNDILRQFLNSNKAGFDNHLLLLSSEDNNNIEPPAIDKLSYEQIFQPALNDITMKKLFYWIVKMHSFSESQFYNKSTIIADDSGWWLTNGYMRWLISFEKLLNDCVSANNMSMLCALNISKISTLNMGTAKIREVISCHDIVITDDPFMIYTRPTNKNSGGGNKFAED